MLGITQVCVRSSLYSWGILICLDNLVNLVVFSEECRHRAWSTDAERCPLRSHIFNTELEDDIIFCHITFTLVHTHFKKLQFQKHFCRFYVTAMEDSCWDFTGNKEQNNTTSSHPSFEVAPGVVKKNTAVEIKTPGIKSHLLWNLENQGV